MNDKLIQLRGPFTANQDIISALLKENSDISYIKQVGIQAKSTHQCKINTHIFEIGKTEMLEFNEVQIKSLYFLQNEPESTIIDLLTQ